MATDAGRGTVTDYTQDPDFMRASPADKHAYLMAVDKNYAAAPANEQQAYLASLGQPQQRAGDAGTGAASSPSNTAGSAPRGADSGDTAQAFNPNPAGEEFRLGPTTGRATVGNIVRYGGPVAAGAVTANPFAIGAAGAGSEALAQKIEGSETNPTQIAIAGALPPAFAGAARVLRGVPAALTRLILGRLQAAHEGALEGAQQLGAAMAPEVGNVGQLFSAARQAGSDLVPARNTLAKLDDLERTIGPEPVSAGLQTVRQFMDKLRDKVQLGLTGDNRVGPTFSLSDLLQQRLDLSRSLGKAPEVGAILDGVIKDLSAAADAGGPGAAMAKTALQAFKADKGVQKWAEMVEKATEHTGAGDVLNGQKLMRLFGQQGPELAELLGPTNFGAVGAYVQNVRTLPPRAALQGAVLLRGALPLVGLGSGSAMGAALGGLPGAGVGMGAGFIAAPIVREVASAAQAVGPNGQNLNQFVNVLSQAARAATMTESKPANQPAEKP
jgi:hypothetical protein